MTNMNVESNFNLITDLNAKISPLTGSLQLNLTVGSPKYILIDNQQFFDWESFKFQTFYKYLFHSITKISFPVNSKRLEYLEIVGHYGLYLYFRLCNVRRNKYIHKY